MRRLKQTSYAVRKVIVRSDSIVVSLIRTDSRELHVDGICFVDFYSLWFRIFSGFINLVTNTVTNSDIQLQMDYKWITIVTCIVSYHLSLPSLR